MSNTTITKSTILGRVDQELLKKALELIAEELGIKVSGYVENGFGNRLTSWDGNKILGSLITRDLPRGIGVGLDKNGELIFVGDTFGCQPAFQEMQKRIEFAYRKIALIVAVRLAGLESQILQNSQEGITLEVVQ